MQITELWDLLGQGRYADSQERAERLLRAGDLDSQGTGAAYLVLSRSLVGLFANQEALGPAELAVHYARLSGDNELLGQALCHAGFTYHENRLHKQAILRLNEYFHYHSLYKRAQGLEGQVLANLAICYRSMGRGQKALAYFRKAYRWHQQAEEATPAEVERWRANLAWQSLKMGEVEEAVRCLTASEEYLRLYPSDLDARARHWNNLAFHAYLTGTYRRAMELASRVLGVREVRPLRKAHACLTLHYTARALGKERVATGMAVLARIQAGVARRPDLEEEASRSLLQSLQQQEGLPLMEDLFRELGLRPQVEGVRSHAAELTPTPANDQRRP